MKYQIFYDAPGGSGSGESSKLTLVYDGEEAKTFDLANLDEAGKKELKQLAEKGLLHNHKMRDFAEVEKKAATADEWLGYLLQVKNGQVSTEDFIADLEGQLGRKLTKQEADEVDPDEDLDGTAKLVKTIQKNFDDRFSKIENQLKTNSTEALATEIQRVHDKMATKYNGKDGMPEYKPNEVQAYIDQNKLYSPNLDLNYEQAYRALNWQGIIDAEHKKAATDAKNLNQKRHENKTNPGNGKGFSLGDEKVDTSKSYNRLSLDAAKKMQEQGVSLYDDD